MGTRQWSTLPEMDEANLCSQAMQSAYLSFPGGVWKLESRELRATPIQPCAAMVVVCYITPNKFIKVQEGVTMWKPSLISLTNSQSKFKYKQHHVKNEYLIQFGKHSK